MKYFLFISIFLTSCSASNPSKTPTGTLPSSGISNDPLQYAQNSARILLDDIFFPSFIPAAKRVSMFNGSTLSEDWGVDIASDVTQHFPLPDYDGVGLINDTGLELRYREESQKYSVTQVKKRNWRYARGYLAAATVDSQTAILSHWRLNSKRKITEFNYSPTSSTSDGQFWIFLGDSGKTLVLADIKSGSYFAIFRWNDESEAMALQIECLSGVSLPADSSATLTAAVVSEEDDKFFAAVGENIYAFSLGTSESCSSIASGYLSKQTSGSIMRLETKQDSAGVAAITSTEKYLEFEVVDNSLSVAKEIPDICDSPASIHQISTSEVLIGCGNSGNKQEANFMIVNRESNKISSDVSIAIDSSNIAAFSLDIDGKQLMFAEDSAFGKLRRVDIETGEEVRSESVFIKGIFSK